MKKKVLQMLLLGMFVFLTSQTFAQLKVSGIVKSTDGEPLPGVTVVVKGTNTGVITDIDGKYNITATKTQSILIYSFVGMQSQEIAINGKTVIDVTLSTMSIGVDEVVVTALGITKEKKSLAYSVSEVKSDDLSKAGNSSVMKSLDGKVSGINFTSLSSDPTSSVLVNIRGTSTLPTTATNGTNVSMNGQPLYVIDGIAVGAQSVMSKDGVDFGNILSQLNPEDIESVTVLKGGSAGALYGADGGNGVVMITTKSGRGAKKGIGVSVNTAFTVEQPYQFLRMQEEYGQGERANAWEYDNSDTWGPKLDGSYTSKYWNVKTQSWSEAAQYSSNENRVKAFLQNGSTLTTNVSVTGNYDKGSFRASVSNMGNEGVMPNTKTTQTSISFNTEYKITDKVRITADANYVTTYSPNKANSTGSSSELNDLLFNFPANLQPLKDMKNYWLSGFQNVLQNGTMMKDPESDGVALDNPWFVANENIHRFTRNNFFGKLQLNWQFSKEWSALLRTGMESVNENYELRKSWGFRKDAYGQFNPSANNTTTINSDAILTYNKTFGKFGVSASGGFNYNYSRINGYDINAGDLAVPGLFTLGNAVAGTLAISSSGSMTTSGYSWGTSLSYAAYGTASLSYDNKFFVDITGRNDWKGFLSEQKIRYFYPSVSGSWVVTSTFDLPKAIDLLKIRLSWADVGNGLTKTRNVDTYTFDDSNWGSVKTASISSTLVDPNIKSMHSRTTEGGIDLWMLDKRVMFDFTYFVKDQVDQLGTIPTIAGTGYTEMTTNVGDVRNKGFEWGLTVTPIKNKNWTWDIAASFTHYKAKISRLSSAFLDGGDYKFISYDGKTKNKLAVGEDVGNIYEQNPILKVKSGKYAGMYLLDSELGKFQDSSDELDREKLGNFNPDYILSINTTLRYKRFTLNVVGSLRKGGKYVSVNQQYMDSNGKSVESLGAGSNNPYWVGGRDAAHGGLAWPSLGASKYSVINAYNDQNHSDFQDASYARGVFIRPDFTGDTPTDDDYIVNGSDLNNTFYDIPYNAFGDCIWDFASTRTYSATNFKLKEVSLSYSVPNRITNKFKMTDLSISLVGRNVFQWNASGRNEDPESAFTGVGTNQGILRATLPSIRSIGFKLGVNF
jgi:TonB-linked SusC/RagA family outer membrane protein